VQESLFSPLWYRVADQHPHLRAEVRVQRHHVRGERWYILVNTANGRQFRVNRAAYEFIGRCDGVRSVQQVWDELMGELGDHAPTQPEVVQTLADLDEQELLAHDSIPEAKKLVKRRDERTRKKVQGFVNPFAMRIPLGNPSKFLSKLDRVPKFLFSRTMLAVWLAVVGVALAFAASTWDTLSDHAAEYMATPRYILLAWVCFPLLKTLHELGHALAVRRWGGEVHDAGFSLFVLVPAPYVDASASAAFPDRFARLIVAAAGMMVELFVAALALAVWMNVESGLLADLAFVMLFTAGLSTLVFNGNPLLRFDAYYMLCDAFDLPNLDSRSKAWWMRSIVRVLRGSKAPTQEEVSKGEIKWLAFYAPAAFAYRIAISAALVLWLGSHSSSLAVLVGFALGGNLLVKPVWAWTTRVLSSIPQGATRRRAAIVAGSSGLALLVFLCAVPLPFHTTAAAVVWPPERARVRLATDGFVKELLARDGDRVAAGQVLVKLEDPALIAQRDKLTSRIEQLQADRFGAATAENAGNAEEEIAKTRAELANVEQKIGQLELRAQTAGTFVMPHQDDLTGTFIPQGTTLAHVLESTDVTVRAALPEYDAALVRESVRHIEVRMADEPGSSRAELVRDAPAATTELPSAVLGDRAGGPHATDPADKDGLHTQYPVVLIDLKLPARALNRIGARAWVRFDLAPQPLAGRFVREVRQVLLQHFNPGA
jgi:putative peptide zinc metalloprotease protein